MRLINVDELDIAIYESFVFGRLMKFEKGEKTIDETADLIVEDAEEAIKEQLKDAPTVEAIPVEWIQRKIDMLEQNMDSDLPKPAMLAQFIELINLKRLVTDWEKEKNE